MKMALLNIKVNGLWEIMQIKYESEKKYKNNSMDFNKLDSDFSDIRNCKGRGNLVGYF